MCRGLGVSDPLEPFVAGFVAELSRQGFQPVTVGKQVGLLAGLSGWLAAEGVAASGLSSEVAERLCAARRAAGHRSRVTSGRSVRCWGICAGGGSRHRPTRASTARRSTTSAPNPAMASTVCGRGAVVYEPLDRLKLYAHERNHRPGRERSA
jgi:hypothetical protein